MSPSKGYKEKITIYYANNTPIGSLYCNYCGLSNTGVHDFDAKKNRLILVCAKCFCAVSLSVGAADPEIFPHYDVSDKDTMDAATAHNNSHFNQTDVYTHCLTCQRTFRGRPTGWYKYDSAQCDLCKNDLMVALSKEDLKDKSKWDQFIAWRRANFYAVA